MWIFIVTTKGMDCVSNCVKGGRSVGTVSSITAARMTTTQTTVSQGERCAGADRGGCRSGLVVIGAVGSNVSWEHATWGSGAVCKGTGVVGVAALGCRCKGSQREEAVSIILEMPFARSTPFPSRSNKTHFQV